MATINYGICVSIEHVKNYGLRKRGLQQWQM
nr:MAG TPA: hypothetical protein [Caudoviricetes sp.]